MTDLNAELEKLRQTYIAELPAKAQNLMRASERARTTPQPNWRELETLSHKLAGSSGTYGFAALSKITRRLEDALSDGRLQHLATVEAAKFLADWEAEFRAEVDSIIKSAKEAAKAA